jgi:hypothetical protein
MFSLEINETRLLRIESRKRILDGVTRKNTNRLVQSEGIAVEVRQFGF